VGVEEDALAIIGVLHRNGPEVFRSLADEPELRTWTRPRLEHAVTAAWSRCLIYFNEADALVAL